MTHKYGYLLIEGLTKENALLFNIVTVPEEAVTTVPTKSGEVITDKNGQTQKRLEKWATVKIVEWFEDAGAKNTPQQNAIYAARDAYNAKYPANPWPIKKPLIWNSTK